MNAPEFIAVVIAVAFVAVMGGLLWIYEQTEKREHEIQMKRLQWLIDGEEQDHE
jgi:hypothetical protein